MPRLPPNAASLGSAIVRTPGLVIGGTSSNAGKTVCTLALLCALRQRGIATAAAKVGPDYIDTAFHAAITERPAANLDAWMCRETAPTPRERANTAPRPGLCRIIERMYTPLGTSPPDLLVIEGAMGLYDGGQGGAGSTARLAAQLSLPVLLVCNAAGMGQSVAALISGFLRYGPPQQKVRFLGILCTHVGSAQHAALLRQALAPVVKACGTPLLGLLPRQGAPDLPARHLGLVQAHEALQSIEKEALANWFETHCHVDRLLQLLRAPRRKICSTGSETAAHFFPPRRCYHNKKTRPLLGIAWDEAFNFCYADLPALLAELGARIAFFSPLRDAGPPSGCAGLYFPGGYPELHAARLAANASMRASLQLLAAEGLPMYGECGGYIYLMQSVRVGDTVHAMCGLLPRSCTLGQQRAALGYRAGLSLPGWPSPTYNGQKVLWVRGHEFHYAREDTPPLTQQHSTATASTGTPLWRLYDSRGTFMHDEGCRAGTVAGSWLHCYPEGARRFWRAWLHTLTSHP